jgi:DNA-binding CsgD family transcriptional regulator
MFTEKPRRKRLTPRERQVIHICAQGKTRLAVARELGISVNTVKGYLQRSFEILGVHSLVEAFIALRKLNPRPGAWRKYQRPARKQRRPRPRRKTGAVRVENPLTEVTRLSNGLQLVINISLPKETQTETEKPE